MSKEVTIFSARFETLGELQTEIENALDAARSARVSHNEGSLHEDEIDASCGQIFIDEETLTDGSRVYNLRIQ